MTPFERRVLLIIPILALAFSAYEMAGLLLPGWHTISFYAQHNFWLDLLIAILFLVGGVGGVVWWIRHMRSRIYKAKKTLDSNQPRNP